MSTPTARLLRDLVSRADAYILALRQVIYSRKPDVREAASNRLDQLGMEWREARDLYDPALLDELDALRADRERLRDERYYDSHGRLKWGHPKDVGHLIEQLKTLDPAMRVSSVMFIDRQGGRDARAYGLSMSYERWGEDGWLNFKLDTPKCLAIWATQDPRDEQPSDNAIDAAREQATPGAGDGGRP